MRCHCGQKFTHWRTLGFHFNNQTFLLLLICQAKLRFETPGVAAQACHVKMLVGFQKEVSCVATEQQSSASIFPSGKMTASKVNDGWSLKVAPTGKWEPSSARTCLI